MAENLKNTNNANKNVVMNYEYTPKPAHIPSIVPYAYGMINELQKRIDEAKKIKTIENIEHIPIADKYSLSVQEAAEYYGIGEKRLRCIIAEHINEPFVLEIGTHVRIKRRLFEEFLDRTSVV